MNKCSMYLHKAKMGLDNHIKPSSPDKTTDQIISIGIESRGELTHYALGKDSPRVAITSAIQIVADLETPTRQ